MNNLENAKRNMERGDYTTAIGHLSDAIENSQNESEKQIAYRNRGVAYGILHQYDEALKDLNQALSIWKEDIYALCNRGNVYKDTAEYLKAIEDYNKVIGCGGSEQPAPHFGLGEVKVKMGETNEAMEHYIKAFELAKQVHDENLAKSILERMQNAGLYSTLSPFIKNPPTFLSEPSEPETFNISGASGA